ncbi:hypothetical protein HII13_000552 [Brettanomyces bruxellensis]|uniref:DEBR0S2_15324g1_1 n=1 Tax=Dekkera bruxellensis TaxID=5007 RepID=A0A7D9H3V5_DEKBR|nr:hypothetical protein HII12_003313 [Brettanomyces bruxellensis]KAF6014207.1 hypothetical protein HII13_000552 [Brettanomyces bruxellensis]VUG17745.1 DEBR0S2_15324g1_1 [Brettanomyces bruxellensis]
MRSVFCLLPLAISSAYAGPMLLKRDDSYDHYSNVTTVVVAAPFSNSSSTYSSANEVLDVTPIPDSEFADVTTVITLTSIIYHTETRDDQPTTVEELTTIYNTVTSEAAKSSATSEEASAENENSQNSDENTNQDETSGEHTTVVQTLTNFVTASYEDAALASSYSSNATVPMNSTYIYTTPSSSDLSTTSSVKQKYANAVTTVSSQATNDENASSSSSSSSSALSTNLVSSDSESSSGSATTSSATSTSSGSKTTYTGRGTYYGVGQGNCGWVSQDSQHVVAISQRLYNTLSNQYSFSEYCGRHITASYQGKSVTVEVVDSCGSCSDNDLDFSESAFKELADLEKGVIQVEWYWD